MDREDRIAYLKSLSKEGAARILYVESVALEMGRYRQMRCLKALALLTYGSDKVFDYSVRSLGVSFATAYLAPPAEDRDITTALGHCAHLDHSNAQTAAILMANLLPEHIAQTAQELAVTPEAVETALIMGIAELLSRGQLMMLSVMSTSLHIATLAARRMRETG